MTAERTAMCAYCGSAIDPHVGKGRPTTYCSAACRRAMENALRRSVRALERLDDRIAACELVVRGIEGGSIQIARDRLEKLLAYRADVLSDYSALLRRAEGEDDPRSSLAERGA